MAPPQNTELLGISISPAIGVNSLATALVPPTILDFKIKNI